jgi:hypothetical protein
VLDERSAAALEEFRQAQADARKAAAAQRVLEIKRAREARIAQCVIKPVMNDDEIKVCKDVSYL